MQDCRLLIATLFLSLASLACHSSGGLSATASNASNNVTLRSIPAVLNEETDRVVEVATALIDSSDELRNAQFVDAQNGWANGRQVLYRTSDAGKHWKSLNLKLPQDSYISSFFFISPTRGWLSVIHHTETERYGFGYSSAIKVTNDGGDTWSDQVVFSDEAKLRDISFFDEKRGLAVGDRTIDGDPPLGELFAVQTDDGGHTWKNITERIKPASLVPPVTGADSGRRIHWVSSSQIFLLTRLSRVIASNDSGETWKQLVRFTDVIQGGLTKRAGFYKLLFNSVGQFTLLGGSRGDEGYWTNLVTSEPGDSWQGHELIRIALLDAILLSENEILGCGEERKPYEESAKSRKPPVGIVLHSKDNGRSWTPIYRTSADETLIYLTKITDTDFYAISNIGNFIKLTMK